MSEDVRGTGAKYDGDKCRLDLVFPSLIEAVGWIRTYGVKKYKDPDNWKTIADAKNRYTAAAMRHFEAWRKGELIDPESGYPHLAHCATNVMFLIEIQRMEDEDKKNTYNINGKQVVLSDTPSVEVESPTEKEIPIMESKFVETLKGYDIMAKLNEAIDKRKEEENKEDK